MSSKTATDSFQQAKAQVLIVKAKMDAGEKVEKPVIFETLLSPADCYKIPTPDQIKDEAYAILNAAYVRSLILYISRCFKSRGEELLLKRYFRHSLYFPNEAMLSPRL